MKMEKEQAHWIYKTMNEIRFFEEKVHKIFSDGRIPGFVHLYVGEEAILQVHTVVMVMRLQKDAI